MIEIRTNLIINHRHYFILGYRNINTNIKTLPNNAKNYLNMLSVNGSKNIFDISARVTSSSTAALDHKFTNDSKRKIFPSVINYDITNHYPVTALVCKNIVDESIREMFGRSFSNFKVIIFKMI